jgi:hypothetical protein
MESCNKGCRPPKKFKAHPSAGEVMASVFWDLEGVIHADFLPPRSTVNAQYHSNLLLNDVHAAIHKKRPGILSKGSILLHDNARPHTEYLTTLATFGWEILNQPP